MGLLMHPPSTHPLFALPGGPHLLQGFGGTESPKQLREECCPRGLEGHVLAQALGPPGSVSQCSQYCHHNRLASQGHNDSSLRFPHIYCLKGREQNEFPSTWHKEVMLMVIIQMSLVLAMTATIQRCHLKIMGTSVIIGRILSVFVTVSTLISPQALPFSLKSP